MREILFRGKRVDNGEWAEGYLVKANGQINNGKCYILPTIADFSYGDSENRIRIGCFVEIAPATVGQYTGLTDKNGKKIWEGDICKGKSFDIWEVCFGKYIDCSDGMQVGFYYWRNGEKYGEYFCMLCSAYKPETFEVIGNIHDNPELLQN